MDPEDRIAKANEQCDKIAKEVAKFKPRQSVVASIYVTVECMQPNVTDPPTQIAYAFVFTHFDTFPQYNIITPYDGIITALTPQPHITPPFKNTHLVTPHFLPADVNNPIIPESDVTLIKPQFLVSMHA